MSFISIPDSLTALSSLPEDPEKLKLLVTDLSRRLQNALFTIEAQKKSLQNMHIKSEDIRRKYQDAYRLLGLETAKNASMTRKKQQEEESKRYEKTKSLAEKLHEDFRLATIDHQISGAPREPIRISKLKNAITDMENKQDSQKLLLRHICKGEELIEDLCVAAQTGNLESVMKLVHQLKVDIHTVDSAGYLPIHYAISKGHIEVVRCLLECGSDATNYVSNYSAMELAARYGHIDCIYELLRVGVSVEDAGFIHDMHTSLPTGTGTREYGTGTGGINNDRSTSRKQDNTFNTPLMSAIRHNQVECVRELIELGANIFVKDGKMNNILHVCAGYTVTNELTAAAERANVTMANTDSTSLPMLELLLSYDFNIIQPLLHEKNSKGQTPLRVAIDANNTVVMKYLNGFYNHIELVDNQEDYRSNLDLEDDFIQSEEQAYLARQLDTAPVPVPSYEEKLAKPTSRKLPSRTATLSRGRSNANTADNATKPRKVYHRENHFRMLSQNIIKNEAGEFQAMYNQPGPDNVQVQRVLPNTVHVHTKIDAPFNEHLDFNGSVVSALTMISQHED